MRSNKISWCSLKPGILIRGYIYPLGLNFTIPGGEFNDAVLHFATALVNKQKTGGKFYVR